MRDSDGNYTLIDGKAGEEEPCKGLDAIIYYDKNKLLSL